MLAAIEQGGGEGSPGREKLGNAIIRSLRPVIMHSKPVIIKCEPAVAVAAGGARSFLEYVRQRLRLKSLYYNERESNYVGFCLLAQNVNEMACVTDIIASSSSPSSLPIDADN